MDTFGARLAAARKAAKLSQEALAREVGVALMTISRYERDAMGIDDDVLDRIASRLGRSKSWFRYGEDGSRVDTSDADDAPTDQDESFEMSWRVLHGRIAIVPRSHGRPSTETQDTAEWAGHASRRGANENRRVDA